MGTKTSHTSSFAIFSVWMDSKFHSHDRKAARKRSCHVILSYAC